MNVLVRCLLSQVERLPCYAKVLWTPHMYHNFTHLGLEGSTSSAPRDLSYKVTTAILDLAALT